MRKDSSALSRRKKFISMTTRMTGGERSHRAFYHTGVHQKRPHSALGYLTPIESKDKTCLKDAVFGLNKRWHFKLHAPIVYGLLAHSHTWNRKKSRPIANITKNLSKYDRSHVSHPRECLDILCIANLAAWTSFKVSRILPKMFESPLFK